MLKLVLALIFVLSIQNAFSFPRAPFDALKVNSNAKKVDFLGYDFEGIVKLSNCSGSLIQFSGQPDTANALVMTNGHCLSTPNGMLKPGEVWNNRAVSRSMKVFDKNMKLRAIKAIKVVYATMTNTDVTIYELNETYAQIAQSGIEPLVLDGVRPIVGVNIDIVSGYWDRGYTCNIDGFVFKLEEAGWTFSDSIRYSKPGCETIGGTSGSPIIQKGTRFVVGINNTGNEDGGRCTMNNPCEIDANGNVTVLKKTSYGQQTYNFYSCLTPDFKVDLQIPGCTLPK